MFVFGIRNRVFYLVFATVFVFGGLIRGQLRLSRKDPPVRRQRLRFAFCMQGEGGGGGGVAATKHDFKMSETLT